MKLFNQRLIMLAILPLGILPSFRFWFCLSLDLGEYWHVWKLCWRRLPVDLE